MTDEFSYLISKCYTASMASPNSNGFEDSFNLFYNIKNNSSCLERCLLKNISNEFCICFIYSFNDESEEGISNIRFLY